MNFSIVLFSFLILSAHGLSFVLDPHSTIEYFEVVRDKPKVVLSYEVISGTRGKLSTTLSLNGQTLYSQHADEDEYIHGFNTGDKVILKFTNSDSYPLTISFRFQAGAMISSIDHKKHTSQFVTEKDMDDLSMKVHELSTEIYSLQDEQRNTRQKQILYKESLTTMNRKILFASLFEIAVMVLCCMLQYILFRNFIYTKYGQR